MQRHLLWYPWLCAAMIAGIIVCIVLILHMLFSYTPEPANIPSGAHFVKEAVLHAAV